MGGKDNLMTRPIAFVSLVIRLSSFLNVRTNNKCYIIDLPFLKWEKAAVSILFKFLYTKHKKNSNFNLI